MLNAILHFIPDDDEPGAIVSTLMAALPPGSYLGIYGMPSARKLDPDSVHGLERVLPGQAACGRARGTGDEFRRMFFDGLDLVPPGLVPIAEWGPRPGMSRDRQPPRSTRTARSVPASPPRLATSAPALPLGLSGPCHD